MIGRKHTEASFPLVAAQLLQKGWVGEYWPQLRQLLAMLSVGFLPVLLLALPAAVVEDLAPCAPQGDLALHLLPHVHLAVHANALQGTAFV